MMQNRLRYVLLVCALLFGQTLALAQIPQIFPTPIEQFTTCKVGSTQWSTTNVATAPGNNNLQYTITNSGRTSTMSVSPGVTTGVTSIGALKPAQPSYVELTVGNAGGAPLLGIYKAGESLALYPGSTANSYAYYGAAQKYNNNVGAAYGSAYGAGAVIGIAFSGANLWFSLNGTWQGSATLAEVSANITTHAAFTGIAAGLYYIGMGPGSSNSAFDITANFGATAFSGVVPRGYRAGVC